MKKAVFLFVVFSLVLTAGCSALSGIELVSSKTGQPTPTHAATAVQTPVPSPTPVPTQTPLPEPTPEVRAEARFSIDLDGDGADETVVVFTVNDYPYDGWDTVAIEVLGRKGSDIILSDFALFSEAYLTYTQSGQPCVLICCEGEDAADITYICSFKDAAPVLQDETYGAVRHIDETCIIMSSWGDFIGSWGYSREYELTNDFKLAPVSDMMIETEGSEPLVAIRKVPVEMGTDSAYTADTLPAGTSVWPVSADGEGHMTFRLKDGRTGRITYTQDDDYGYALIDGVNVDEYFDNIEYWG
jgi:hypothetical protein